MSVDFLEQIRQLPPTRDDPVSIWIITNRPELINNRSYLSITSPQFVWSSILLEDCGDGITWIQFEEGVKIRGKFTFEYNIQTITLLVA